VIALFLSLAFSLGAYLRDETVTGYLPADGPWVLQDIDGTKAGAPVSLSFAPGRVMVEGPCLRLRARQTAPYPWFEVTGIDTSANACPLSPEESGLVAYFSKVNVAEVSGPILILSEAGGAEMLFRLSQP
jgi:heat shock protein HslJ